MRCRHCNQDGPPRHRLNADVSPRLRLVAAALGKMRDADLQTIFAGTSETPYTMTGFVAWLEHLADWELDRRAGRDYLLQLPEAAMPSTESAMNVATAMTWGESCDRDIPAVAELFNAVLSALAESREPAHAPTHPTAIWPHGARRERCGGRRTPEVAARARRFRGGLIPAQAALRIRRTFIHEATS